MRIFPKTGLGNVAAMVAASVVLLDPCGWGFPPWAGAVALVCFAANAYLALLRWVEWLFVPPVDVLSVSVAFFAVEDGEEPR